MSQPAQQKQKNILPLLIAAFALLLLFYLNSDEVDQQAHLLRPILPTSPQHH